jgi:LAO/AO transport system kinase
VFGGGRKASPEGRAIVILLREIIRGNPRAIGRAISLVEDGGAESRQFMKDIRGLRKKAPVVGITGAPGVGKSTLADRLNAHLREFGLKVGVVAIDPTSPFTGGAVLGDRIRMIQHSADTGVYIRSMASRGHRGGLSKAADDVCAILTAAGMDMILLETVGIGQAEVDVINVADLVLVVLTPGSGDDIQTLKAGIMEIADIFVLNKADLAGAPALEAQVRGMIELGDANRPAPPIFRISATEGRGIEPLGAEILKLVRH